MFVEGKESISCVVGKTGCCFKQVVGFLVCILVSVRKLQKLLSHPDQGMMMSLDLGVCGF